MDGTSHKRREGTAADHERQPRPLCLVINIQASCPPIPYHARSTANTKTRPAMHELPKELGNSLRSFRNSVQRHSGQYDLDLEKLEDEGGKKVHETPSSLILV